MRLEDVEVFVEAVQVGSLAGAARRLSLSSMAASRSLGNLEAELGVRLVHRTTRSLSPTSDGETFLPHAQALLEGRANALADLRPHGNALSGHLRITASAAFARKVVAPMLSAFMAQHPALRVDLLSTDEQVDIVAQGIDVAIRIAPLRDNRLVARRLADSPRVLCVAPAYLSGRGRPQSLAELSAHDCLVISGTSHWSFVSEEKSVRQRVAGRFAASSIEALYEACVGGLGIANLSRWYVEPAFAAGVIEPLVLMDAEPEPLGIWAVYPTSRLVPQKVRMFIDTLESYLHQSADGRPERL
ncbi:DNA-binding transcriptional regulator, LysR family [Pseudomonas asplenii]|uniref:DNA-binding transcriptional regulator, LysR family n=1 Tax=Pseudomonas asplenii TaxID=53407 RepID=A0A1H1XHM4_9PSED|nr:LysR family transcriptional regulator [Pseudomonas asplenii]SDT08733.1 DNA-binding transcriptional regulator, LysR family [Pseudomonas asplenii]